MASEYLLAVFWHLWTVLFGVIMALVDVWQYKSDKQTKFTRTQIVIVLFIGLLAAQFLAWRDEYTKVIGQTTYMAIVPEDSRLKNPMPFFELGKMPAINLGKENRGSYIAMNQYSCAHIYMEDAPTPWIVDPYVMPTSTPTQEDSVYEKFRKACKAYQKPVSSFQPNEHASTRAAADFTMNDQWKQHLIHGEFLMYVLAYVVWTDGTGTHEQRNCWLVRPPAEEPPLTLDSCYTHNDFLPQAQD